MGDVWNNSSAQVSRYRELGLKSMGRSKEVYHGAFHHCGDSGPHIAAPPQERPISRELHRWLPIVEMITQAVVMHKTMHLTPRKEGKLTVTLVAEAVVGSQQGARFVEVKLRNGDVFRCFKKNGGSKSPFDELSTEDQNTHTQRSSHSKFFETELPCASSTSTIIGASRDRLHREGSLKRTFIALKKAWITFKDPQKAQSATQIDEEIRRRIG